MTSDLIGPIGPSPRNWWREGWFVLIGSGVSILIIGTVAYLTHEPWIFPSLGPTAYILFAAPLTVEACPRNAISSHLIGIVCGVAALAVFGLLDESGEGHDLTVRRVLAVTLALVLTFAFMTWLRVPHAPAGATTMIVALGVLFGLRDYVVMMLAVVLLVVMAAIINRLHGDRTPLWAPRPAESARA